jgi:hypothetical protein
MPIQERKLEDMSLADLVALQKLLSKEGRYIRKLIVNNLRKENDLSDSTLERMAWDKYTGDPNYKKWQKVKDAITVYLQLTDYGLA